MGVPNISNNLGSRPIIPDFIFCKIIIIIIIIIIIYLFFFCGGGGVNSRCWVQPYVSRKNKRSRPTHTLHP